MEMEDRSASRRRALDCARLDWDDIDAVEAAAARRSTR